MGRPVIDIGFMVLQYDKHIVDRTHCRICRMDDGSGSISEETPLPGNARRSSSRPYEPIGNRGRGKGAGVKASFLGHRMAHILPVSAAQGISAARPPQPGRNAKRFRGFHGTY